MPILSIISQTERRKATVAEVDDGCTITYYRSTGSSWRFDYEATAKLPFHAALDLATHILDAPPRLGGRL